ncbi:MAG: hypothetical protein CSA36_01710 [Draconibacterium sp.]|nr:MAG: hypothetical protein CSA36_01710 [Draconibacterium sp.]
MQATKYIAILISIISFAFIQSCSYSDSEVGGKSETGTGGSMARFTIAGDKLFTVNREMLSTFDISSDESPVYKQTTYVGRNLETIFPMEDKLLLGSNSGMFIFDISKDGPPQQVSFYEHIISCDPVVSDGKYAYVTLSNVRVSCQRAENVLQIIDIEDIKNPTLVKQYPMEGPRGLAIRNDTLWVCDNGIKLFDVSDKMNINELLHFNNIAAYDVILDKNRALVVGETGFFQYITENDTLTKLSEIK